MIPQRLHGRAAVLSLLMCIFSTTANSGAKSIELASHTFEMEGLRLIVPVPSSAPSRDLPRVEVPLDIGLEVLERTQRAQNIFEKMWDWRVGIFRKVIGSIVVRVTLIAPAEKLECREDIQTDVQSRLQKRIDRIRRLGAKEHLLPQITGPLLLRTQPTAVFSMDEQGTYEVRSIIAAVGTNAYIEISTTIMKGNPDKSGTWRSAALETADAVLSGVRFEGEWPDLPSCERATHGRP